MIPIRDSIRSSTFPIITLLIIAVNLIVFLYQIFYHGDLGPMIGRYAAVPSEITKALADPMAAPLTFATLITSLFLHGGLFHLAGNMLYLWVFGDNIEDRMGRIRFLFFYLLCGVIATATHIYFNSDSSTPLVGASGAIAGVLGAYLLLYPFARVQIVVPLFLIFPIVRIPALFFLGGWFAMQVISGYASHTDEIAGGTAWWAHAGGFLAGVLLVGLFAMKRK